MVDKISHLQETNLNLTSLVMLLIHVDILKGIWFIAFPATELAAGKIDSKSPFCQAAGFFAALVIELSDFSVAMIAIHTALYIFKGPQGLYPYRKVAYAVALLVPLLLASLAFIRKPGYYNTGNFCYLPIQPAWIRKALSWIPRYITLGFIILTYLVIYIYVKLLMRQFGKSSEERRVEIPMVDVPARSGKQSNLAPPPPHNTDHSLGSSNTTTSSQASRDFRGRQFSAISNISTLHEPQHNKQSSDFSNPPRRPDLANVRWKMPNFNLEVPGSYHERLESEPDLAGPSSPSYVSDEGTIAAPSEAHVRDTNSEPSSSRTPTSPTRPDAPGRDFRSFSIADTSSPMNSRSASVPNLFAVVRRNTSRVPIPSSAVNANTVTKTRERIHRQLNKMFIYPLVYLVVWILPFFVHLTNYTKGVPFGLVCATITLLSAQGLVNALIFSWREKPWRHIRKNKNNDSKFWKCDEGEKFNLKFWKSHRRQESMNPNVGRTREEMLLDGRCARERRDVELEERRVELEAARAKAKKDWWDDDQV